MAAIAAVLVGAAGCSSAPPEPPVASPTPTDSADGSLAFNTCAVSLPEAWQDAIDNSFMSYADGEQLRIDLVAADGSWLAESKVDGSRHELRWFPNGGSEHVLVHDFGASNDEWQVLGADFDGRYLVYSVYHSFRLSSWSLYVWDSQRQGEPTQIAENSVEVDGEPFAGPLNYPVAYDGQAVWVQATGEDDETALYQYDIAEDRQETLTSGHPTTPFRMGDLLLWPESPAPGELTVLRALSLRTGEEATPPGPLPDLEGPAYIDGSDDTVAWIDSEKEALWVWREGWDEPHQATDDAEVPIEWVEVAGDLVTWDHRDLGQHALDLRTGGYAPLTPEWGWTESDGGLLMVGFMPDLSQGKANAVSEQAIIDTATLPPLPGCD